MRINPRDWRIEDLKVVAVRYELASRQQGTSHVVFRTPNGEVLSVPVSKPIKPVYIKQFVRLIDNVKRGIH
jgi:hypothetical protein